MVSDVTPNVAHLRLCASAPFFAFLSLSSPVLFQCVTLVDRSETFCHLVTSVFICVNCNLSDLLQSLIVPLFSARTDLLCTLALAQDIELEKKRVAVFVNLMFDQWMH